MWSHREQLLRVARRRSMSAQDAEDAVHEAMVRAAERPHVDGDRLGAWLTTVTVRLCVDRYRQLSRDADIGALTGSMLIAPGAASLEEAVCDRAEAVWLADRGAELPERQAEAMRLKTEDLEVAQVAQRMGLTYKAVESLLGRARRTLRAALAGTLALALWAWRGRPRVGGAEQAAALGAAAVTLVIVGLAMPTPSEADGSPPTQTRLYEAVPHRTPDSDSTSLPASNESAASSVPTDPHGGPVPPGPAKQPMSDPATRTGPTRPVQPVPESPTFPIESAPDLPTLPVTSIPDLPTPPIVVPPIGVDRAPDDLPGDLLPVDVLHLPQH